MGRSVILCTGAALCILLFAATTTSAQPISIYQILQLIQSAPKSYPSPVYAFNLCMEITNRVFNDSLYNPATAEYKKMYNEVSGALNIIYNCSICPTKETYRGVTSIKFSKGSVVANCTISFQTIFINNVVIKYLFLKAIENNFHPNGLVINKDFTNETVTPIWHFTKATTPMTRVTSSIVKASGLLVQNTTVKPKNETQPAILPTFLGSVVNPFYRGVPGWAIALLVLACVTLLLIFILILLLCFWCCTKRNKKDETEHAPYERTSFKEHLTPYNPQAPQHNQTYPVLADPEFIKNGNRSEMYVVNPQR
ncbi:uncharacterized protein [Paramisgurnus dabryanus]|uniref:uncharacterized protein n=1 Tax=Paramisgurnus dabryanus TaxID=90735 RepID=UPI0031F40737